MNTRQRFSRYSYPQIFFVIACGVLLSLLFFWFALPKISQKGLWQKGNTAVQNNEQLLGFKVSFQPSAPVWDFFGIIPAAASPGKNCTYTVQYLSVHPELWKTSNNISTSRFSFTKDDLLSIFQAQTQDTPLLLQQQFLAAALNMVNGADPQSIEASMRDASHWIDAHPPRIDLPEADSQTGLQLIQQLQDYNDGNTGPGLCSGQSKPFALIPTATEGASSTTGPTQASKPALTYPPATESVMTVHKTPREGKNSNSSVSGSGGQSGEAPSPVSVPAVPSPLVNEQPQAPADSAAANPPPPVDSAAPNLPPPTQVQQSPDSVLNPPPTQAPEQDKEHRHSNRQQPEASTPAPQPTQAQSEPQSPDTPAAQQPADSAGSGSDHGKDNAGSQGTGGAGNSGSGNEGGSGSSGGSDQGNGNGGGQGNGAANDHGNGNSGGNGNGNGGGSDHGNGNSGGQGNGNSGGGHGGGGHGKGH